MKKLLLLLMTITVGLLISCNRDESDKSLENEIQVDRDIFEIENGYILDYGLRDDFYYWQILLTDGEYDDYSKTISQDANYLLVTNLYSTTNNLIGDFEYVAGSTTADRVFTSSDLITNFTNNTGLEIESGTISVSGSLPNLTFDVVAVADGERLNGNFNGSFKVEPGSFDQCTAVTNSESRSYDLSYGSVFEYGPIRLDGGTFTHSWREMIITDEEFDIGSECPPLPTVWFSLYSLGENGPLEGTYTYNGDSYFYPKGRFPNGDSWYADDGTITITHDENNNYYVTWTIQGTIYINDVKVEGIPPSTITGEFKYSFDFSNSFYCS